jgi:hypothetical protein
MSLQVSDVSGFSYNALFVILIGLLGEVSPSQSGNSLQQVEKKRFRLKMTRKEPSTARLSFSSDSETQIFLSKLSPYAENTFIYSIPRKIYHPLINKGFIQRNSNITELSLTFKICPPNVEDAPSNAKKRPRTPSIDVSTINPTLSASDRKRPAHQKSSDLFKLHPILLEYLNHHQIPFKTHQISHQIINLIFQLQKASPIPSSPHSSSLSDTAWTEYSSLNQVDISLIAHSMYFFSPTNKERIVTLTPHAEIIHNIPVTGRISGIPDGYNLMKIGKLAAELGLPRFLCPPFAHTEFIKRQLQQQNPDPPENDVSGIRIRYLVDSRLLNKHSIHFDMGKIGLILDQTSFRRIVDNYGMEILDNLWEPNII